MSVIDEFLDANSTYAKGFTKGDLPLPPARKVAVVMCMDARIDPAKALGLEEGMPMSFATPAAEPRMPFAR